MSDINLEDLTPGTVVAFRKGTVVGRGGLDTVTVRLEGCDDHWITSIRRIKSILSRPETDADKIARLERELAERDARIAELTAFKAEPTTPVWSDPIDGPPPKGLPAGSYQVARRGGGHWGAPMNSSDVWDSADAYRILMHQEIQWEGGECPVPVDWEVLTEAHGGCIVRTCAGFLDWSKPFTFTLTSTGGGNG